MPRPVQDGSVQSGHAWQLIRGYEGGDLKVIKELSSFCKSDEQNEILMDKLC